MTRRRWAIVVVAAETVSAAWLTPRVIQMLSVRMMRPIHASPS